MKTKSKLLLIVTFFLLTFTAISIVNVALNMKDLSLNNAVEKAKMTAEIVKDGLTAHMVNGIMDQRGYFLEQISHQDQIKSLWLARSEHVVKQYGAGFNNELPRDNIDKEVLKSGKLKEKFREEANSIFLRVTIPYKATTNCLSCHDVKNGDVLGAISMEFDITNTRTATLISISKILGVTLIFIVILLLFINYYITPYINLFTNITNGLKQAYNGNFTHKFETTIVGDGRILVDQLNTLFSKMQSTFGNIKHDLATFIPDNSKTNDDPLHEASLIITELSDIYKFKKTIELDPSKTIVYSRIVDILKYKYNIQHFALYELNNINHTRTTIHITDGNSICLEEVNTNTELCRAHRTKSDVISTEFKNLCTSCNANDIKYVCIPFSINKDHSLILSISSKDTQQFNEITSKVSNIKRYLEAAKPVIESKLLMEALRDTSLKDAMTGLYNRRFLEEVIDQIMHKAKRDKQTYTLLMLDVDFFKKVNDTYGHDIGDKVIVEIGAVIQNNIRESDLGIRYGGEEFIVMLDNATDDGANTVAKKIHQAFGDAIFDVGNGQTLQKTMSIGVAKFPRDADSIWQCIKLADTALYVAKTTGRNKIVEYDIKMSENENVR